MLALSPSLDAIRSDEFTALIDDFVINQDVKASSQETYRKNIKLFLEFLHTRGVTQPTQDHIRAYKTYPLEQQKSGLTVNNNLVAVKLFFKYLRRRDLYPDIADEIKLLRRSADFYRDALLLAEVKDLLAAVDLTTDKGNRDFALINLLLRTGIRTIEACRANNEDIRKDSEVHVLYIQGKGCNEKNARVVLTHSAYKPLAQYQITRKAVVPAEPLFTGLSNNSHHRRLTTRSISRLIQSYYKKAGIFSKRVTPHSLRHTAVTLALKGGATVQEAKVMVRHKSINTTMIYAHNIDRMEQAAEFKIEKILEIEAEVTGHDER